MIGNADGLRWTIVFVTLRTGFSLMYTQTRQSRELKEARWNLAVGAAAYKVFSSTSGVDIINTHMKRFT